MIYKLIKRDLLCKNNKKIIFFCPDYFGVLIRVLYRYKLKEISLLNSRMERIVTIIKKN